MCDPVTITMGSLAVANLGIGVYGDIQKNKAQKKQATDVRTSAHESAAGQINQLSLRGLQEKDSAALSIMGADRQARLADGQARVAAGEGGVAGASVDALLHDLERQRGDFRVGTGMNLNNTLTQINAEKRGVRAQEQSVINGAPFPSNAATGINIASRGVEFGTQLTQLLIRKPKG